MSDFTVIIIINIALKEAMNIEKFEDNVTSNRIYKELEILFKKSNGRD